MLIGGRGRRKNGQTILIKILAPRAPSQQDDKGKRAPSWEVLSICGATVAAFCALGLSIYTYYKTAKSSSQVTAAQYCIDYTIGEQSEKLWQPVKAWNKARGPKTYADANRALGTIFNHFEVFAIGVENGFFDEGVVRQCMSKDIASFCDEQYQLLLAGKEDWPVLRSMVTRDGFWQDEADLANCKKRWSPAVTKANE